MYINETTTIPTILDSISRLNVKENELLVLFIGEDSPPDLGLLIDGINALGIKVIGGVFPGIIYCDQVLKSGIVAQAFPVFAKPYFFPDHSLASIEQFKESYLKQLPFKEDEKPVAFVLSSNLSLIPYQATVFCEELGNALSDKEITYIGGATGETILRPGKYIFDNNGLYSDGTFLTFLNTNMSVKYGYGWTPTPTSFIVTKSDKNVILELNGQPAMRVFQQQYRLLTNEKIEPDEINVTKQIHIGIVAGRSEKIMRGIIGTTPEGGLILAGGVREKSMLFFMKSTQEQMVMKSVALARSLANSVKNPSRAIVIECITRHILSQDHLSGELQRIRDELAVDTIVGFLAWGEITQLREGKVEFMNESILMAVEHTGV